MYLASIIACVLCMYLASIIAMIVWCGVWFPGVWCNQLHPFSVVTSNQFPYKEYLLCFSMCLCSVSGCIPFSVIPGLSVGDCYGFWLIPCGISYHCIQTCSHDKVVLSFHSSTNITATYFLHIPWAHYIFWLEYLQSEDMFVVNILVIVT